MRGLRRHLAAFLFLSLALAGSSCSIRKATDPMVVNPNSMDRLLFGDFWEAEGFPSEGGSPPAKVAVAGFSVEFVLEKIRDLPDERGVGRRANKWGENLQKRVPAELYLVLRDRVRALGETVGREVTEMADVVAAKAYSEYRFRSEKAGSDIRFVTPQSTDTGKIRSVRLLPATGLKVIDDSAPGVEIVDRKLLEELGVDAVIRARFRIGVQDGKATVEQGSVIHVTTRTVSGTVTSLRSLAGGRVLKDGFLPTPRGDYSVNSLLYLEEIRALFLNYVDLAVEVLR